MSGFNLQLRHAVLNIIWQLLLPNAAQIPENHTTIVTATAENGFLKWMPSQRCDLVVVTLEGVDHAVQVAEIPDADRLIRRTSSNNVVRTRGKGDCVDGVGVTGALE